MNGFVHSIETFGLVDGPGVRCVVFLQGCAMRCRYCHNPDTWRRSGGTEYTAAALLEKLLRFRPYWRDNGGITVSGGEAMLQAAFVTELFTLAKREGVHTALDTAGQPFGSIEGFGSLMDVTDLFLLDIKEMDSEKHRSLTGHGNANILAMARYLSDHGKEMWIRHVLVPGLTDDEEGLLALRDFIGTLKTVTRAEILPYHTLGMYRWEKLGIPYTLKDAPEPAEEEIRRAKDILGI